ncbi:LOW QUALITY PROTEIN: C-type lectin domain family 17, member A [Erethizon dorsatum]
MLGLYGNTARPGPAASWLHPGWLRWRPGPRDEEEWAGSLAFSLEGSAEEEEDGDDYENTAPPRKGLPPKPGSVAPPRPPKAGNKVENPPLPRKPPKVTAPAAPVPWASPKPGGPGRPRDERLLRVLCLLVATSLLLSGAGLAAALLKCQEAAEALRTASARQRAWQRNVTGVVGLAGLRKDIDRLRADTNQSLLELRGLLECTKVTCPDGWLPFESKCYYFSPRTKSWDDARKFCQENYSHLVIIDSPAEHNFVVKAHGSPRVYWLGLNDKDREGDWRWLDGSPVTLSFWDPQEPNNLAEEDCASMNRGGTWNDLACAKTAYWICERQCSC